jgi:hypothetical protein
MLFPDEGEARTYAPDRQGGMLLLGDSKWLPCD